MPVALACALAVLAAVPQNTPAGLYAACTIEARLDEPQRAITGTQTVTIHNDGDRSLSSLWFHLHPNAFGSRGTDFARELEGMADYTLAWAEPHELGGIDITRMTVNGLPPDSLQHETEMEILLPTPLAPGSFTTVEFDFTTRIPRFFVPGLGRHDRFHVLSHWYPQLAARGGDTWCITGVHPAGLAPAHPADYDVVLTVPADLAVAATGRMLDDNEELKWSRWPPDFVSRRRTGTKTLRFEARAATGFTWVASPDLVLRRVEVQDITVDIFTRARDDFAWTPMPGQVRSIIERYVDWYGRPARDRICVVDANGITRTDASFDGVSLIAQRSLPLTRILERALARQLAWHWFGPAAAPDPPGSSWLVVGPAVFSEIRYLEERYGPSNLLDLPAYGPLTGFGDAWYNRLNYYLAQSNHVLGSLAEPSFDYTSSPFSYSDARFAQAGSFIRMLERRLGSDAFDRALRAYLRRRRPADALGGFIAACSDAAGTDLGWLFDRWLPATGPCDYAVTGARRVGDDIDIGIRRVGSITMPVEVELEFADGSRERRTWDLPAREGVLQLSDARRLRRVTLDPDHRLLEPDRWNNHWPRRVSIHPIVALPSFDDYQLFYGPYPWYDTYHGFLLGAWAQGRQFIDTGPLRGRHSWSVTGAYATKLKDWQAGVWYQTPLPFVSDRLRIISAARYAPKATSVDLILEQGLSPILRQAGATVQLGFQFQDMRDIVGRDPRAWETARTAEIGLQLLHSHETKRLKGNTMARLGLGSTWLGGEYDYGRASIEHVQSVRFTRTRGITVRSFAGAIPGSVPHQAEFYLSGGLVATAAEPVSWGYEGGSSGQENWHYTADVNCRGYAGEYHHGRYAYGLNVLFAFIPIVRPFFDIGNVGDDPTDPGFRKPRMDAGVRLQLGWLYADFPLWRYRVGGSHEFSPNWMLGLNFAGLGDF